MNTHFSVLRPAELSEAAFCCIALLLGAISTFNKDV